MKRQKMIALALTAVMIFSAGCGKAEPKQEKPVEAKAELAHEVETLKLEGGTDWGAPSPYLHASRGPGSGKMKLVFGSLLENDEKGAIPWLAKEWSVDGKKYTFTLQDNAKFHDETPITTADVAFTIDYSKKFPPVSAPLGVDDKFIIDSYNVVNDKTIEITVGKQNANTLTTLGSFVIIPKHVWENVEDPYTYNEQDVFIGSGAYKMTGYNGADGSYEFTAFDEFCAGKPSAGRILFVPVSDSVLAFENNEVDIISAPADLMEKYNGDESIGVISKDNDMGYKLLVNFEKKPEFLDIEMRKAFYSAFDRQGIVDKVFRGCGEVGSAGYAPSGSIFYNDKVMQYPYDKEAAAKYFKGKNIEVNLITANAGNDVDIAELIKLDLEAVGVKVNVSAYDLAVRDDMVNSFDYEFALIGNGGWGGKAPVYLRTIFSDKSKNKGGSPANMGPVGYSNAKITELAEAQNDETDFDKRIEIFKELQMEISKEIPVFVIATQTSYSVFKKDYYDGWMKTYDYQQAEQNRLSYMSR